MLKPKKPLLLFLFFHLSFHPFLFADETLTITTYYPSPYGSYNELQTNKLAVGDTNGDSQMTSADLPSRNGDIRLMPQSGDPAAWPAGNIGQLSYSSTEDAFYYYNGSAWVAQGGGGGCYTKYGGSTCASGWTAVVSGYTTLYGVSMNAAAQTPTQLACSSVTHGASSWVGVVVYGTSINQALTNLSHEPCVICCK